MNKVKSDKPQEPIRFTSVYRHGLDEKRRLQIPARWRSEPGVELTLVLWPAQQEGSCLRVMLPEQLEKLIQEIEALPKGDPKKVVLRRFIGSKSAQVPLDNSGRILLPEDMAKSVGITNEAVLVGLLDRFEIWGPDYFAKEMAADEVMAPEALKMME